MKCENPLLFPGTAHGSPRRNSSRRPADGTQQITGVTTLVHEGGVIAGYNNPPHRIMVQNRLQDIFTNVYEVEPVISTNMVQLGMNSPAA
jgi:hypothetical protein